MMWDGMGSMGGFAWVWMVVWGAFLLVLLVCPVLAVVWLARNIGGDRSRAAGDEPHRATSATAARAVLDLRYARGELGHDEYHQVRRDLEHTTD